MEVTKCEGEGSYIIILNEQELHALVLATGSMNNVKYKDPANAGMYQPLAPPSGFDSEIYNTLSKGLPKELHRRNRG